MRVRVEYTNWRGLTEMRNLQPRDLWYGVSSYHGNAAQWFVQAIDVDKQTVRDFAYKDIVWPEGFNPIHEIPLRGGSMQAFHDNPGSNLHQMLYDPAPQARWVDWIAKGIILVAAALILYNL